MYLGRIGRRIDSLERSLHRRLPAVDVADIVERVLVAASDEDFTLFCRVRCGTITTEALTDRECEALQTFIDAVQQECQRLGFSNWQSLERWRPAVKSVNQQGTRAGRGGN